MLTQYATVTIDLTAQANKVINAVPASDPLYAAVYKAEHNFEVQDYITITDQINAILLQKGIDANKLSNNSFLNGSTLQKYYVMGEQYTKLKAQVIIKETATSPSVPIDPLIDQLALTRQQAISKIKEGLQTLKGVDKGDAEFYQNFLQLLELFADSRTILEPREAANMYVKLYNLEAVFTFALVRDIDSKMLAELKYGENAILCMYNELVDAYLREKGTCPFKKIDRTKEIHKHASATQQEMILQFKDFATAQKPPLAPKDMPKESKERIETLTRQYEELVPVLVNLVKQAHIKDEKLRNRHADRILFCKTVFGENFDHNIDSSFTTVLENKPIYSKHGVFFIFIEDTRTIEQYAQIIPEFADAATKFMGIRQELESLPVQKADIERKFMPITL